MLAPTPRHELSNAETGSDHAERQGLRNSNVWAMVGATAGFRSESCALLDYIFIAVLTCALNEIGESTAWRHERQRPDSTLGF
jgi:hypothetical protein